MSILYAPIHPIFQVTPRICFQASVAISLLFRGLNFPLTSVLSQKVNSPLPKGKDGRWHEQNRLLICSKFRHFIRVTRKRLTLKNLGESGKSFGVDSSPESYLVEKDLRDLIKSVMEKQPSNPVLLSEVNYCSAKFFQLSVNYAKL